MTAPTVAIIGAGPCGLTLARLLECKGIDYTVYERDRSPACNRTGGSLDIRGPTGQLALRECGLLDKFRAKARYEDTVFSIADKAGERLLEFGQGHDAPEIDRAELRQILLDSVPRHRIKWGHVLQSATVVDGRAVLQSADHAIVSGSKLVVGADGAWSKVRAMITPAIPQNTGKSIVVSTIGHSNPSYATVASKVRVGSSLSTGSGKFIMIQRQGDASYKNIVWGASPRESVRSQGRCGPPIVTIEVLRRLVPRQKDIIRHSIEFCAYPLYSLSSGDMSWTSVRGATLVGDAAHLSYPGGKGVNLATTDALELASKIAQHGDNNLDQAVREYEAGMLRRAVAAIMESRVMEGVMYSDDPRAFLELVSS